MGRRPGRVAAPLRIRAMEPADVAVVANIERAAFSSPWSPRTFAALAERPGVDTWVGESDGGEVVAYAILWRVLDEAELANIAVREDHRGRGIGSVLLDHVLRKARSGGVRRVHLEVRESNADATVLYRSRGFRDVGRRRDYYDSPREDALLLSLDLE